MGSSGWTGQDVSVDCDVGLLDFTLLESLKEGIEVLTDEAFALGYRRNGKSVAGGIPF